MKSLLAALGLSLVLTFNVFAADTAIDHSKTNLLTRPAEPTLLKNLQQPSGKIDTQGPQACSHEYEACSFDSDCCSTMKCVTYGTTLVCRFP
jgi:hypothetical protein